MLVTYELNFLSKHIFIVGTLSFHDGKCHRCWSLIKNMIMSVTWFRSLWQCDDLKTVIQTESNIFYWHIYEHIPVQYKHVFWVLLHMCIFYSFLNVHTHYWLHCNTLFQEAPSQSFRWNLYVSFLSRLAATPNTTNIGLKKVQFSSCCSILVCCVLYMLYNLAGSWRQQRAYEVLSLHTAIVEMVNKKHCLWK